MKGLPTEQWGSLFFSPSVPKVEEWCCGDRTLSHNQLVGNFIVHFPFINILMTEGCCKKSSFHTNLYLVTIFTVREKKVNENSRCEIDIVGYDTTRVGNI